MSIAWVLVTLVLAAACAGLCWLIGLGNAMCTVPRRFSAAQLGVIAVPWIAAAATLAGQVAAAPGETKRVLLWNSLALLLLLGVALACAGDWIGGTAFARRWRDRRRAAAADQAMERLWQEHGRRERFALRVEAGLAGRFADAHGSERPGAEWFVVFETAAGPGHVTMRSFAPDATTELDAQALTVHARCVLDDLEQRLASGWLPSSDGAIVFVACAPGPNAALGS